MTAASALPQFPWLTLLVLLPLGGALLCLLHHRRAEECRWLALATTAATLGITIYLFVCYGQGDSGWLLYEDAAWIPRYGIRFTLGLDGISLLLVLLTAFLQVIAVLMSWPVKQHVPLFFCLLLVLEATLMGIFLALDLMLFFLFWEVMLLPMFFLISIWGHERRHYAAMKFFLYTLAGSLVMLVALIVLYLIHGEQTGTYTFALAELMQTDLSSQQEMLLFLGFLLAFAIKIPLVPFHTWLPDAHTEAPIAGTIDLTGLLLKTGIYGLIRFAFPLFPEATRSFLPALGVVALIGIFHAGWAAYRQDDIKRLFAYSSISHVGLVVLGLAAWQLTAWEGSVLLMLAHGVSTGALFVLIALIRQRTETRNLSELGGLWGQAPQMAFMFLFFSLASLGLPGLANFAGEILVLLGTFQTHPVWAAIALIGIVFTAAYMLRLVQGVVWGPVKGRPTLPDLTPREWLILLPMAVLVIWLGLYPEPFLRPLHGAVANIMAGGLP